MRWFGLALGLLLGCVPIRETGGESSLPLLDVDEELDDHEVKEELRWALYRRRFEPERLLAEARAAHSEGDWALAHERAFALVDEYPSAREAEQVLWVLGRAAAEVGEPDRAQRAMRAALCVEAAPEPLLGGAMPPFPRRGMSCTEGPAAPDDPAAGWAMLADVEESLGHPDASDAAMERAISLSAPGSDVGSETRAWMVTTGVARRDRHLVFRHAAALVDEGGRPEDVDLALRALANAIADDDWNGDGRKDARIGASRPVVSRWLARGAASGPMVLREATRVLLRDGRCTEARRIVTRLARLAGGADHARALSSDLRACVCR